MVKDTPDKIKKDLMKMLQGKGTDEGAAKLLRRAYILGRDSVDAGEVAEVAEEYVRAEVMFRLGPRAYQDATTAMFVAHEEKLRKAVTGSEDLHGAAKALKIDLSHLKRKR